MNMSMAPAVGLMFTTRTRVAGAVKAGFASVITNDVTAAPPVPPIAKTLRSSAVPIVTVKLATVTVVSAVFLRMSDRAPVRIAE